MNHWYRCVIGIRVEPRRKGLQPARLCWTPVPIAKGEAIEVVGLTQGGTHYECWSWSRKLRRRRKHVVIMIETLIGGYYFKAMAPLEVLALSAR